MSNDPPTPTSRRTAFRRFEFFFGQSMGGQKSAGLPLSVKHQKENFVLLAEGFKKFSVPLSTDHPPVGGHLVTTLYQRPPPPVGGEVTSRSIGSGMVLVRPPRDGASTPAPTGGTPDPFPPLSDAPPDADRSVPFGVVPGPGCV